MKSNCYFKFSRNHSGSMAKKPIADLESAPEEESAESLLGHIAGLYDLSCPTECPTTVSVEGVNDCDSPVSIGTASGGTTQECAPSPGSSTSSACIKSSTNSSKRLYSPCHAANRSSTEPPSKKKAIPHTRCRGSRA